MFRTLHRARGASAVGARHPGETGPFGPYGADEDQADEDDTLRSTTEAITELRQLAKLVGFGFEEGLRQVEGERDTDLPRGPYTFEDLVGEVTAYAYAMADRVREAFGVPLPAYEPQSKAQMPEGGWPDPWGGNGPTAA